MTARFQLNGKKGWWGCKFQHDFCCVFNLKNGSFPFQTHVEGQEGELCGAEVGFINVEAIFLFDEYR